MFTRQKGHFAMSWKMLDKGAFWCHIGSGQQTFTHTEKSIDWILVTTNLILLINLKLINKSSHSI
jgi:hypothetical protein